MSESTPGFVEEGGVTGPFGSELHGESGPEIDLNRGEIDPETGYPVDPEPQDNDGEIEPDPEGDDEPEEEEDDPDASADAPDENEAKG